MRNSWLRKKLPTANLPLEAQNRVILFHCPLDGERFKAGLPGLLMTMGHLVGGRYGYEGCDDEKPLAERKPDVSCRACAWVAFHR